MVIRAQRIALKRWERRYRSPGTPAPEPMSPTMQAAANAIFLPASAFAEVVERTCTCGKSSNWYRSAEHDGPFCAVCKVPVSTSLWAAYLGRVR